MEDKKENLLTSGKEVNDNNNDNNNISSAVNETEIEVKEKLEAKEAELMRLIADPKIMRAYRAIRSDIYGVKERYQVSKKEKQKKKAKRRMAKKSRRG
jgi:hypothetical protein